MVRILAVLACCFAFAAQTPALASPQTDADYIATRFVTDDEFQTTLRDMMKKAHAEALAHALSARSVKVRDPEKLTALLPDPYTVAQVTHLQNAVAAHLVQTWEPAQIASAADYLRQSPLVLNLDQSAAKADPGNSARPLAEVMQETADILQSDVFRDETALSSVAVTLIFLTVQEGSRIAIDLKAPYVADMLEVNGVFNFLNRIVRNDLIRELRGSGS